MREFGPRKPHTKFYDSADWRETRETMRQCNPICQRIKANGKQCTNQGTIVHHLIDPRIRPDLRLAFSNLVCVCAQCHPGGQMGANKAREIYVHTIGLLNAVYKHTPDGGWPSWRKEFNPADIPKPHTGRSTIVGEDALDRALAAYEANTALKD